MRSKLRLATPEDAPDIADLRAAVAAALTAQYGKGPWSGGSTQKGVRFGMRTSRVYVARRKSRLIATLRLTTRKPWAIDTKYFTPCSRPLYLLSMAVAPDLQRQGIGRSCLAEAIGIARQWPAEAIRLDAYDAPAGAGQFYCQCGFRGVGRATYRGCPLAYLEYP
jgi:GNAT superfamily N-acetyltransferase